MKFHKPQQYVPDNTFHDQSSQHKWERDFNFHPGHFGDGVYFYRGFGFTDVYDEQRPDFLDGDIDPDYFDEYQREIIEHYEDYDGGGDGGGDFGGDGGGDGGGGD